MISITATSSVDALIAVQNKNDCYKTNDDDMLYRGIMGCPNRFTFSTKEGDILAIMGFTMIDIGVCQGWALTTKNIKDNYLELSKAVRRVVDFHIIDNNIHRMEIIIRADFETGFRWAEFLGFEQESVLKMYNSDKTDSVLYRRLS